MGSARDPGGLERHVYSCGQSIYRHLIPDCALDFQIDFCGANVDGFGSGSDGIETRQLLAWTLTWDGCTLHPFPVSPSTVLVVFQRFCVLVTHWEE